MYTQGEFDCHLPTKGVVQWIIKHHSNPFLLLTVSELWQIEEKCVKSVWSLKKRKLVRFLNNLHAKQAHYFERTEKSYKMTPFPSWYLDLTASYKHRNIGAGQNRIVAKIFNKQYFKHSSNYSQSNLPKTYPLYQLLNALTINPFWYSS